ncbi:MAG: CoA transferase [Gammaproteobacteria bacterium TMED243]|jgi:crotonobetainyl-CoA:carnitine CoA-transferase CaiB-like acyl-CoA transferase|nr:carnitine dehydratase [Gammaproteobacteria bacterium]RPG32075.1 MAG: CoA transferase [Gammaproteobacteria bacterium TMED243]
MDNKPLHGIRVIEVGQLLAGPFAGTLLAYFGADVIKVEPPGDGDPIRGWRLLDKDGTSFWWRSLGRNKKSLTLNLRTTEGRDVLGKLLGDADVLIENFKPGTMEKWGLGPEDVKQQNPGLIYTRISGYGQTGPYSSKPGYASVTEAYSGFRYINGFDGEVPVRPNLSLGDSVAGLHAAMGILLALLARKSSESETTGQVVDVALYESMFNLMEGIVPEYSGAGDVRQPAGSTITGIVPTNTYLCADAKHVVIGGNGDSIYVRLMTAIGREDLANDPRLAGNPGRVTHQKLIDGAIAAWADKLTSAEVIQIMEDADVPVGAIFSIADAFDDPHYQARGLFEHVAVPNQDQPLAIPAILPKLTGTPGSTEWPGGEVGSHTDELLQGLGLDAERIAYLKEHGIV